MTKFIAAARAAGSAFSRQTRMPSKFVAESRPRPRDSSNRARIFPIRRVRNRNGAHRSRRSDNRNEISRSAVRTTCAPRHRPLHFGENHFDVFVFSKNPANRRGDIRRRKRRGRDLVKERLKKMIIRPINHRYPRPARCPRCLAASRPPKPAPMITTRGSRWSSWFPSSNDRRISRTVNRKSVVSPGEVLIFRALCRSPSRAAKREKPSPSGSRSPGRGKCCAPMPRAGISWRPRTPSANGNWRNRLVVHKTDV